MVRASAVAICGALVTLASNAGAQLALVERVRVQGGYIAETRPTPRSRVDDVHVGAIPELSLLWGAPTTQLSLTYAFTGTLHSEYASEIANHLSLQGAFEVSRRTTLVLTGTAAQTTLNNLLLSQPASASSTGLFPTGGTTLLTANVGEGISHELSPRVRFEQQATASVFKTLDPSPPLESFNGILGGGIERVWRNDGLGAEGSVGYAIVRTAPPTPEQKFITGTLAPRWRHDWSRSVSSLVAAGGNALVSPVASTKPLVAPFARASLGYAVGDSTFDLLASTGVTPNPLTGQTVQAHQVSLHVVTPLSMHARLFVAGSAGYVHGTLIDRINLGNDNEFNSALSDLELVWQAAPLVQVYARYTFIAQVGDTNALGFNPSFVRQSFLIGVAISSRPVDGVAGRGGGGAGGVRTRLPQRVDRTDGVTGPRDDNAPDVDEQRRPPPEGVGGSRWTRPAPAGPPQDEEVPSRR
jgi:hypothetical protein